jgi:catechol 2,3-dioxygenase-like lactoylglutathione lyase family enzyme
MLLAHASVGTNDIERAITFYDAVFATIGQRRATRGERWAAYGDYGDFGLGVFWLLTPIDGKPATAGNGTNIGLLAPSRAAVDDFYQTALAMGGTCEGKPGIRADDHPNFYAAYIRDLDRNKLVVVCHRAP